MAVKTLSKQDIQQLEDRILNYFDNLAEEYCLEDAQIITCVGNIKNRYVEVKVNVG